MTIALAKLLHKPSSAIEALRQGLSVKQFDELRERLGISSNQLAEILRIPSSTLARRRIEKKLNPEESDRLYRLAHVHALATQVLGDQERASLWFKNKKRALGDKTPLELADTQPGIKQIETLLHQIEQGLFV